MARPRLFRTHGPDLSHRLPVACLFGHLYNHESPPGRRFVTMKIARAAARIKKGQQQELVLGSLEVAATGVGRPIMSGACG